MGLLDKPKQILNPSIWKPDNQLLPNVKAEIISKLKLLIPEKLVKQLWFIGGNASYQYNDYSDIDINVISRIPGGIENKEKLYEWHQLFKYHNKSMDFLTGTKHPINYFIQHDMDVTWGDETTSIYLIKDYDTGEEDRWERLPKPFDKIRDPEKRYQINSIYAKLYSTIIKSRFNELKKDVKDLSGLDEKKLLSKLKEVEDDIYELIRTYNDIDGGRKLQYSFGWGIPKQSDKNFLYKYLERKSLLDILSSLKDSFKKK